jgi:hypothetical protein
MGIFDGLEIGYMGLRASHTVASGYAQSRGKT